MTNILQALQQAAIIAFSASAWYSLSRASSLFNHLKAVGESLSQTEEVRLDRLLSSGKYLYNTSLIAAVLLLALSTLASFQGITIPLGNLILPEAQAPIIIHVFVILLVVASQRFLLMALPWLPLDSRRPPHDWVIMGLSIDSKYYVSRWLSLPVWVSSIALTLIIVRAGNTPFLSSALIIGFISNAFIVSVVAIYYWNYLITERMDHRGGHSTFSVQSLYIYRLIRQILLTAFLAYPVVLLIPQWHLKGYETLLRDLTPYVLVLYILRALGLIKPVYRMIDRIGKRFGYPVTSTHYK